VILVCDQSFHGRTLATITATRQRKYQKGFAPLVPGFREIRYNDLGSFRRALDGRVCAILLELIQGEGGVRVADPSWVRAVRRECRARDILFLVDEVQTGCGRTGRMFACGHFGVTPDAMSLAKALGNGVPIGALVVSRRLAGALPAGSHASTFGGNPLACAAAEASLSAIRRVLPKARRAAKALEDGMRRWAEKDPEVIEVRGKGLLLGVEMRHPVRPLIEACRGRGLLLISAGEKVLRLAPPLIITPKTARRAAAIIVEEAAKLAKKSGV
jgi:acetylornithine aminotransferase